MEASKLAMAIRKSEELPGEAKKCSVIEHRSLDGQIGHWTSIGQCSEENPDLTYSLIKEVLIGLEELDQNEKTEYQFG